MIELLSEHDTLTPADHQTHRRFRFAVPRACRALHIRVQYSPKRLNEFDSRQAAEQALRAQAGALSQRVGASLADRWAADFGPRARNARLGNLLTISLDDSQDAYRGAAHRQAPDQDLLLGAESASPGLVAGPLPPGEWALTLSVHTLVSAQCDVSIQIGAETAANSP